MHYHILCAPTQVYLSLVYFPYVCVCYSGDPIDMFLITGTPFKLKSDLKFCPYNGTGCCDLDEDLLLENQFRQMNISNARCASLIRSILCAVSFCCPRTIMMSILGHIYGKLGDHYKHDHIVHFCYFILNKWFYMIFITMKFFSYVDWMGLFVPAYVAGAC